MIEIGPYRFTQHDARRTVDNLDPWFEQLADGRDATCIAGLQPDGDGPLDEALARAWAAIGEAGRRLREAGQLPSRTAGSVAALHLGDGGVPKRTVDAVEVGWRGVVGDRQGTRYHHGRPWQALCIWSAEVIDRLAADGHPIAPGYAGENVTVRDLPWHEVRAGVQLQLGAVRCEVTLFALPCKQNAAWFRDGDFRTMHHERGPVSRVYATVLEPGRIAVGDPAILEP